MTHLEWLAVGDRIGVPVLRFEELPLVIEVPEVRVVGGAQAQ